MNYLRRLALLTWVCALVGLAWGGIEAGFAVRAGRGDPLTMLAFYPVVTLGLGLLSAVVVMPIAGLASAACAVTALAVGIPLAVIFNLAYIKGVPMVSLTNFGVAIGAMLIGLIPGALVGKMCERIASRPGAGSGFAWIVPVSVLTLCIWHSATTLMPDQPGPWPANPELSGQPNILLINIDTLRVDHSSSFGYERTTTPNLDALPALRFDQTYAQAHWTAPSTASLLTGLYPSTHQTNEIADVLPEEAVTLAQRLSAAGYVTGYFTGNFAVTSAFGFTRGSDWIISERRLPVRKLYPSSLGRVLIRTAGDVSRADRLNAWVYPFLESVADRRFFLYIHYKDPHHPYSPPPPYDRLFDPEFEGRKIVDPSLDEDWPITPRERQNMIARYDGEIRFVDSQIGLLFEELKRLKIFSNTLIIVTADHGEEFHEHKGWLHGETVYEEIVRVPLWMSLATLTEDTTHVRTPVRQVDVVPTVLDMLDMPIGREIQGASLRPLLDASTSEYFGGDKPVVSEGHLTGVSAYRSGSMKLIRRRTDDEIEWELYDLSLDPTEKRNLAKSKRVALELLKKKLAQFELHQAMRRMDSGTKTLTPEDEAALRELGYIK